METYPKGAAHTHRFADSKPVRFLAAISICLSGWALLPYTSLPAEVFGWELFAEAYGEIFSDGFEGGDTSRWSNVVGEVQTLDALSADDLVVTLRIDGSNWNRKDKRVVTLLSGLSERDVPIFKLEARRRGRQFEVRARAVREANVWAESPWRPVDTDYGLLELEFQRAMEKTEDGLVYLSIDDDLLLWLVDLDNEHLPLRRVQLDCLDGDPVATTIGGSLRFGQRSEARDEKER